MIQAGDFTEGNGTGGESIYGGCFEGLSLYLVERINFPGQFKLRGFIFRRILGRKTRQAFSIIDGQQRQEHKRLSVFHVILSRSFLVVKIRLKSGKPLNLIKKLFGYFQNHCIRISSGRVLYHRN